MNEFTRNLDELLYLSPTKKNLVKHLIKNYKENIHYVYEKNSLKLIKQNGGQNKIIFMLTETAFELLKNSYNLRNRYIVDISDNVKCINVGMCIENQTIGFIENSYSKMLNVKRQYVFNKYKVDLYFIDYKLVIECDENNHTDRNAEQEKIRESYITSLGNKFIRYNPNAESFDLSNVLREINSVLFSYNTDNFNKLLHQNEYLENENRELLEQSEINKKTMIKQNLEIAELKELVEKQKSRLELFSTESVYQNVLLPEDEMTKKFNEFVDTICIVRPDVEDLSVDIEGRYRLWSQTKPSKEIFHALKSYLDTRFKPKRIGGNHGYIGIKLKNVEYRKVLQDSQVETFIFQACRFSDSGKILNSVLLNEYQKWKLSLGKEIDDKIDMKEIKEYLNSSKYALKSVVWTDAGNNEGYYGLSLFQNVVKQKISSSTGKKVVKVTVSTNYILGTWDSIAAAALGEGICAAKMSRSIKNGVVFGDYCYKYNL